MVPLVWLNSACNCWTVSCISLQSAGYLLLCQEYRRTARKCQRYSQKWLCTLSVISQSWLSKLLSNFDKIKKRFMKCIKSRLDHIRTGPYQDWTISRLDHIKTGPYQDWTISGLDHIRTGPYQDWTISGLDHCTWSPQNKSQSVSSHQFETQGTKTQAKSWLTVIHITRSVANIPAKTVNN